MVITILIFLAILLALVLVHEWGHFFAARKLGVNVKEFGFGFPPRAFGIKRGDTIYSVNWLPLGGFVKLKGEQGEELTDPDSFASQKVWKRSAILVAGVFMNAVLCLVLLTVGFVAGLPTSIDETNIDKARDVKIVIFGVMPDSPAAKAGIKPGDTLLTINTFDFLSVKVVQDFVAGHEGNPLHLTIKRGEDVIKQEVVPIVLDEAGGRAAMGVTLIQTGVISYPWYQAIGEGLKATGNLFYNIVSGFVMFFGELFTTGQAPADVAGPVGIAVLTGQVIDLGWIYVLQFAALLSMNLAIINILPFPALDGGRLLFVAVEKLRGQPNNAKIEAIVHTIGFSFLMLLILVVTYRDIVRITGDWWQNIGNLF